MTPVEQHALAVSVEERIATLVFYRRWYRGLSPTLLVAFAGLDAEYRVELRSLLALRSAAKRAAKAAEYQRQLESWKERHLGGLSVREASGLGIL